MSDERAINQQAQPHLQDTPLSQQPDNLDGRNNTIPGSSSILEAGSNSTSPDHPNSIQQLFLVQDELFPTEKIPSEAAGSVAAYAIKQLATQITPPIGQVAGAALHSGLQKACQQILIVTTYKKLHHLFQQLEDQYIPFNGFQNHLLHQIAGKEAVSWHGTAMQNIIDDLLSVSKNISIEKDGWKSNLRLVQALLGTTSTDFDFIILERAASQLRIILGQIPSQINANLCFAHKELRIDEVINALTALRYSMPHTIVDSTLGMEVERAITALQELHRQLEKLVQTHDRWQSIDDELRLLNGMISLNFGALPGRWPGLNRKIEAELDNADPQVREFYQASASLEMALERLKEEEARIQFQRYRQYASRYFRRVDDLLLEKCSELHLVGKSLVPLLRLMA